MIKVETEDRGVNNLVDNIGIATHGEGVSRQHSTKTRLNLDNPAERAKLPPRDILPRVAIYARVSTEEQTTENQVPVLQEFAERQGWEVVKVYTEEASAWRAGHQHQLKVLLTRASYHAYDIVLVWSLDRLTREGIGNIMQLFNTFRTYGVQVISHQEPWLEQAGPMADLLTAVAGWAAEFESARRSERIKAALERKRLRGEVVGRKPGAKDKKPRKRMGYFERYKDRRKKNITSEQTPKQKDTMKEEYIPKIGMGFIYLIQLDADHDPGLVKIGYSRSILNRIKTINTISPQAVLINTWEGNINIEKEIQEQLKTDDKCQYVKNELFRCDSLDYLVNKIDSILQGARIKAGVDLWGQTSIRRK